MATVPGLKKGENGTVHINEVIPTSGKTPVNAVAAVGTLTIAAQPTAGDTMTIGTKVYTFVAAGEADADGEISVGTDLATAKTALIAAVNGTDSVNTAHTLVTAGTFTGNNLPITAKTKGVAGSSIATTETFTSASNVFDATTLGTTTEGVNGTIASKGGICYIDNSYIYYSIAANTISDANWRRISLGTAY